MAVVGDIHGTGGKCQVTIFIDGRWRVNFTSTFTDAGNVPLATSSLWHNVLRRMEINVLTTAVAAFIRITDSPRDNDVR